jgi:NAD(P)-dependent dehydrogenase (short-subunit alcohol dehydrogenase family)
MPKEDLDRLRAAIPPGRLMTSEEIAAAVVLFTSPAAEGITGTTLVVDGGHWFSGAHDLLYSSLTAPKL